MRARINKHDQSGRTGQAITKQTDGDQGLCIFNITQNRVTLWH